MNNIINIKNVSAVICSWNAIASIEKCLKSLRDNNIEEIIVVDANSDDGTREIAYKYASTVLTDPHQGLAVARNIGIEKVTKDFVVNVGCDNVMPPKSVLKMLRYMVKNNYSGVSAIPMMYAADKNYIAWGLNQHKLARVFPGERPVIGTPTLFPSKLLKENPYDPKMTWSDDGDLCTRLRARGHKFAIANVYVYETGSENLKSIFYRWKGYGKSDWETYTKYSKTWSFFRKINSLTYPLRNELFIPFVRIPGLKRFAMIPFLTLITLIRYHSWLNYYMKSLKAKKD